MKTRIIFASILLQILTVPLWADWGACSIGASGAAGDNGPQILTSSSDTGNGTTDFSLTATGTPLADKTDSLGFASGPAKIKGDCEIVAQVVGVSQGTQDWAAGGLMIRENYGADSRFFAAGCTRSHGIQSFVRNEQGTVVAAQQNCSDCNPPIWLKIVRQGNHFTSYKSMDGRIWLEINEADVPMKKAVWVGAFATSGGGAPAAEIDFAHVTAHEIASQ